MVANYLAKEGLRVAVAERSDRVEGLRHGRDCARIQGQRSRFCFWIVPPQVIEDLELRRYELRQIAFEPQAFCPFPDGRHLFPWSDVDRTWREIARFSK
jgi:phytoene dehydrogenase-like protein